MISSKGVLSTVVRMLALILLAWGTLGCKEQATAPAPSPSPSPQPSPTPSLQQAVDRALFTITFDGKTVGTEEIRVDSSGNQPVVFTELKRTLDWETVERRTMVLGANYTPVQYELERSALGVRSIWATEQSEGALNGVGNNMDWYGPVLMEGVTPPPDVMLEGAPSALPFALLALRFPTGAAQAKESQGQLHLLSMDIIEGLAATRPMTLTTATDRKGAVIGTSALEGQIDGGANPRFTLWIRPGNRQLYSVEIADYQFDPWQRRLHPALSKPGKLVIQRVSKLPAPPTPEPVTNTLASEEVTFTGADRTPRSGTLVLPAGSGPFPVLVAHSGSGVAPRSDLANVFVPRGWAVYSYDKRGIGESEGEFVRGPGKALAEDAIAAAAMLAARAEIDAQRIVFLGLEDGGMVGAQVMATDSRYAAAILGSAATATRIFPDLAQERLRTVLAATYGWSDAETRFYANQSANRWENWLVEGREEVEFAGRRVDIGGLRDWANLDLPALLAAARSPILLLHGDQDHWTPVAGADALSANLLAGGQRQITLRVFPGLDESLSGAETPGILAPAVQEEVWAWLSTLPE